MAKKTNTSSKAAVPAKGAVAKSAAPTTTPVRNSAVPPKTAVAAKKAAVTFDQISARAYGIWQSGQGGNEEENWLRAERELRGL